MRKIISLIIVLVLLTSCKQQPKSDSISLGKGSSSPVFTGYENYNGGTTSLEDFKGKYVYIDVWATWCSICIQEIPYLKIIETAYQYKNVAFVSISVDKQKDYDKWRKMVEKKELTGTQLFSRNSWESKFIKEYKIESTPRFILIDPKGNIISHDAPRPSEEKLIDLLDSLLKN